MLQLAQGGHLARRVAAMPWCVASGVAVHMARHVHQRGSCSRRARFYTSIVHRAVALPQR